MTDRLYNLHLSSPNKSISTSTGHFKIIILSQKKEKDGNFASSSLPLYPFSNKIDNMCWPRPSTVAMQLAKANHSDAETAIVPPSISRGFRPADPHGIAPPAPSKLSRCRPRDDWLDTFPPSGDGFSPQPAGESRLASTPVPARYPCR